MQGHQTGRAASVAPPRASGGRKALTASGTLAATDRTVLATIPLAAADNVVITLPPLALWPNSTILVVGKRASGSYVNGTVVVQDQDDNGIANYTSAAMTATGDYVLVYNHDGHAVVELNELTT